MTQQDVACSCIEYNFVFRLDRSNNIILENLNLKDLIFRVVGILFCDLFTAYYWFTLFAVLRGEPKKPIAMSRFDTAINWVNGKMDSIATAHHVANAVK